jgi:type-F conjugative transfer system pilin assembly protein TrbC
MKAAHSAMLRIIAIPLSAAWCVAQAAPAEIQNAHTLAETAQQRAADYHFQPPVIPQYHDMQAVERLADVARERGRAEFEQLRKQSRDSVTGTERATDATPATDFIPGLIVVAMSSSIPEQTVRSYFAQLDGHREVTVILRGFIGGAQKVKPTGDWVERMLRKHADCKECGHWAVNVVVDPLAYRSLGIEQVPAVAYLPGVQQLQHCHAEQFHSANLIYGAAPIEQALAESKKRGAAVPDSVIKSFGG